MGHDVINIFIGVASALAVGLMSLFGFTVRINKEVARIDSHYGSRSSRYEAQAEHLIATDNAQWARIESMWRDIRESQMRIEDKLDHKVDK